MVLKSAKFILAFTILAATTGGDRAWAQDAGKSKDEALDSLMKELRESENAPAKATNKSATAETKKPARPQDKSKVSPQAKATGDKDGKPPAAKIDKPSAVKSHEPAKLAPKDQAIDDLLGKLGESKDDPTASPEPRNRAPGQGPTEPPRGEKTGGDKLEAKDKDLDERLEELTGRKKKRSASEEERTGQIGEMIKEMREVEQRLGKPDPSEDTQKKQKQIVKRIETLIEQVRQGGSAGSMAMRRMRQQGQQQGKQDGDQPGAQARGAPPMKPAKPTGQHSTAGGKDIWGHLPAELREIMDNITKEIELDSKRELISRYFLSVDKGKLVREE
jgi:hypothetical protein